MTDRSHRLRDPIHNLIVFDDEEELGIDRLAWRLIDTPEFQRLRRIRQLGVSEFVFPGATHTRFSHSVGVYHNARRLLGILKRLEGDLDMKQARVAALAALLHDIGHGPFSHAFENARKKLLGLEWDKKKHKHEALSARLITDEDSEILRILECDDDPTLSEEISLLLRAEDPASIYHAVVSSSFDADRLDYIERDRYMTGTKIGAIDLEWLIDNIDTYKITPVLEETITDDAEDTTKINTFVFKEKARPAAEDFLLARYRLYANVYLHKTTRGFEQVLTALMVWLGRDNHAEELGLADNPLVRFLRDYSAGDLSLYRQLDDYGVWGLVSRIAASDRAYPASLAQRLLMRKRLACLDLAAQKSTDSDFIDTVDEKIQKRFDTDQNAIAFRDDPGLDLYTKIDGEGTKPHKRIRVRVPNGAREITDFDDTIIGSQLQKNRKFLRWYFLDDADREIARKIMEGR